MVNFSTEWTFELINTLPRICYNSNFIKPHQEKPLCPFSLLLLLNSRTILLVHPLIDIQEKKIFLKKEMVSVFNKIANLIKLSMVIIFFFPSLHSSPPSSRGQFCYRKSLLIFKNGEKCASLRNRIRDPRNPSTVFCNNSGVVHIAMTLDHHFFRGTVAAIHSVLHHSSCPENVFFHLIFTDSGNNLQLQLIIRDVFPSLKFKVYYFDSEIVRERISSSVRQALEQPLNYARNYLVDLLEPCIERVIYLDSDVILVDDISKLWRTNLSSRTLGSPEYCHVNFTKYFTPKFWSDSEKKFYNVFKGRKPCYFNTGDPF